MKYVLLYCISLIHFIGTMQQEKPLKQSIGDGSELYQDFCVQCHLDRGQGVHGSYPPLSNSDYLRENLEESIRAIKYGLKGEIQVNGVTYNGIMLRQGLDDEEVADVMNYILSNWGNSLQKQITPTDVFNVQKK